MIIAAHPLALITDDSRAIRRGFAKRLTQIAYRTMEAASGLEALRLMKEHNVECLLLDVAMPDIDGFDVLRALGYPKVHATSRVILMHTDPAAPGIVAQATRLGVRVVEKFHLDVLEAVGAAPLPHYPSPPLRLLPASTSSARRLATNPDPAVLERC